ncbi:hypothetical protein BD410DRAFT_6893 [Rickenella mellea]|uniref:Uncharacterized protein n=1 Tax=Rickenella mellea TaxID=50990 RepID=A0A4R5XEJ4_9AGAM|nr:hypothetical protein BD410DRAFT_6893 [Rickenella mellea]
MAASNVLKRGLPPSLAKLVSTETTERIANLSAQPRNLFETLSRMPHDGVGARVFQTRWQSKGIEGCCWNITRVQTKLDGTRGKAWGMLVWRGKEVSEREEQIRGGLKWKWAPGVSTGDKLKLVQPVPSPLGYDKAKQMQLERRAEEEAKRRQLAEKNQERLTLRQKFEQRQIETEEKWNSVLRSVKQQAL